MSTHVFNKYCDPGRLQKEIGVSVIPKAIDYITTTLSPANTTVVFKEALSEQSVLDLTAIITAHVATPLEENTPAEVVVRSQPAYGDKQLVLADGTVKNYFMRNRGVRFNLEIGINNLEYVIPYPWARIQGVEAINTQIGDYTDFLVYDNALGSYSGVPNMLLNQFGYTVNLPQGFYERTSRFNSDVYQGMKIVIRYTSVSQKTLGVNILMDEIK
jgi:hypothetical protein